MTRTTHLHRRKRGISSNQRTQRHVRAADPWGNWQRTETIGDPDNPRTGQIVTHRNRAYDVQELRRNGYHLLSVRPKHAKFPPSWQDLVRIKDELVGEDRQAVQIYPPREDFVDQGHFAQLWIVPQGEELPFTFGNLHHSPAPERPPMAAVSSDDGDDDAQDDDDRSDDDATDGQAG